MKCEVIQDLLVLYSGECCSEESRALVEEHLKGCESCRKALENMKTLTPAASETAAPPKPRFRRVDVWKASALQSLLLFCSFVLLAYGVLREGNTPEGPTNGLWAFAMIVPASGYLLSLANWTFIRLYPSRKAFANASLLATLGLILACYVWALLHYRGLLNSLFAGTPTAYALLAAGLLLSLFFCVISRLLSEKYARLLGKE